MLKASKELRVTFAPLAPLVMICAAASQLSGCVVRAGVAVPAPAPVYVAPAPPPPPPADVAPAAAVEVQANDAPPPLPEYPQPPCPVEGYLWTPGYWAWGPGGYYWVPGTWVAPPRVGLLWTPGYWGFVGGVYVFHAGYWGPHVGFYGGVNYGFGYGGVGFAGGRWVGGRFAYNQAVTNVNVTVVHNTYNETVINNVTVNRVSYNGGTGGTIATPTAQERMAAQEPHVAPTTVQQQHIQQAATNPALLAHNNGGHPSIAATAHAGAFNAPGVVGARGGASPPHAAAVANRSYGGTAGQANGAHPAAYAAHSQTPNGKPPAVRSNAAKPHPKAQPENGRREPETAQR
jgi:WXXGXW repeat (2 copies)